MTQEVSSATQLLDRLITAPVGQRARVLSESGDAAAYLATLIDHVGRTAMSDSARGDLATDIVVNLADQLGSNLDRARARRVRVHMLSFAGRFDEALTTGEEGRRLAREAGQAIEAARLRLASMHALGELGRLDEAIAAGEAAREEFLAAGEPALAGRADLNLGTVRQRGDDPAAAIRHFDRARKVLLGEPAMLGPLDNNRGEALLSLNDFAGAERAFASALKAFKTSNSALAAAIAESNLADVSTRQGRLQAAMFHFEQARRSLEVGASPAHLARLLAEQAEVMSLLGMHNEAVDEFERALTQLDRLGLALESARARTGLGTALLRIGRHAHAETALAAAATAFDELKHETARARVDLLRAELASINGRPADGRAIAMRALATLHDRPADAASAHLTLARVAVRSGQADQAELQFQHALAIATQMDLAPARAEILRQRGILRQSQSRLPEAIDDLTRAAEQVERVRGSLQADRFRAAFLGDHADVYESLVASLLDRGDDHDVERAFAAAERAKSRLLLDAMQRDLAGGHATNEPAKSDADLSLVERLRHARQELNALYSVVADNRADRGLDSSREAAWHKRVQRCELEVDEIEARLATTSGLNALYGKTTSLENARRLAPAGTAIIEYFVAGDEIMAFIIASDQACVCRRIGSAAAVVQLLQSLQFQISRALRPNAMEGDRGTRLLADARRVLTELAAELITPLESDHRAHFAKCDRVKIVPHGVLHGVPFHALMLHGRHLIETHAVSYAPSASLLSQLCSGESAVAACDDPVVVGVADDIAPQIEDEARLVANALGALPTSVLIGHDATVERVLAVIQSATLLHFACHGRYAPNAPMGSGLRLSDRWLTTRDLMDIRLQAQLVTLSGCETGLNLVQAGDELMGLLRGFFAAGAKRAVASLWRVEDAITREFMAAFYSSMNTLMAAPNAISEAVSHAQRALLGQHPHPAFWAPFFLTGAS